MHGEIDDMNLEAIERILCKIKTHGSESHGQ